MFLRFSAKNYSLIDNLVIYATTTAPPTAAPTTAKPTGAPTTVPVVGNAKGDPHFKTFGGEAFDFHGQCDLVMLQNPSFAGGLGLNVHIRTRISTWWSYISHAVVQIGDQMIEVAAGAKDETLPLFWVNGIPGDQIMPANDVNLEALVVSLASDITGFDVHHKQLKSGRHRFHILLGGGDAISIESFKGFVSASVKAVHAENFKNAKGLMGTYPEGVKLARDGKSVMEDPIEFGKEWQVSRFGSSDSIQMWILVFAQIGSYVPVIRRSWEVSPCYSIQARKVFRPPKSVSCLPRRKSLR